MPIVIDDVTPYVMYACHDDMYEEQPRCDVNLEAHSMLSLHIVSY